MDDRRLRVTGCYIALGGRKILRRETEQIRLPGGNYVEGPFV